MSNALFSTVRERIQAEMAEASIPGFAVGVAREGELIWEEAFGGRIVSSGSRPTNTRCFR